MTTDHLDDLRAQAQYARERYQLYKARSFGQRWDAHAADRSAATIRVRGILHKDLHILIRRGGTDLPTRLLPLQCRLVGW